MRFYDASRGFGFLERDNGPDVFVDAQHIGDFIKGDRVMFDLNEHRGKLYAQNLRAFNG